MNGGADEVEIMIPDRSFFYRFRSQQGKKESVHSISLWMAIWKRNLQGKGKPIAVSLSEISSSVLHFKVPWILDICMTLIGYTVCPANKKSDFKPMPFLYAWIESGQTL